MSRLSLTQRDERAINEFRQRLGRLLGDRLLQMGLFGSKAEGRATPESDIDIFLLVEDSARNQWNQILDEAFEVNLKYGVYISPRVIQRSVYEDPVWRVTPFLTRLREKAVPL